MKKLVVIFICLLIPNLVNADAILATKLVEDLAGNSVIKDSITNDYHFVGNNPNNYISFNNELWRIIGVFNIDDGNGNIQKRLKLVRSKTIGEYSWDSSDSSDNYGYGYNTWSSSDAKVLLNEGPYFNRNLGECFYNPQNDKAACDFSNTGLTEDAKALISNAIFNTGKVNYKVEYRGEEYNYIDNTPTEIKELEKSSTWIGKVGLINISDYAYSVADGDLSTRDTCLQTKLGEWYDLSSTGEALGSYDCIKNTWLLNENNNYIVGTINSFNSSTNDTVGIISNSLIEPNSELAAFKSYFYPVVFLNADINIYSGTGTISDPYSLVETTTNENTNTTITDTNNNANNEVVETSVLGDINNPETLDMIYIYLMIHVISIFTFVYFIKRNNEDIIINY